MKNEKWRTRKSCRESLAPTILPNPHFFIFNFNFFLFRAMRFLALFLLTVSSLAAQSRIGGVVNVYTPVVAVRCSDVTVEETRGFAAGDTVMIIQMKGAVTSQQNAATYGTITSYGNAGNYEIGIVQEIVGFVVRLRNPLLRRYTPAEFVQLIRVPHYAEAIVVAPLTAAPWNGRTGGVLAIDIGDRITLQANIDVSGVGFRGGRISTSLGGANQTGWVYRYLSGMGAEKGEGIAILPTGNEAGRGAHANGGGGGNVHNAGGGGGGNVARGGTGGDTYIGFGRAPLGGLGGFALQYGPVENKIFMGGGGGGGQQNDRTGSDGAPGGGIVIIRAKEIVCNGRSIVARGATPLAAGYDGAGGGGAGGSVLIEGSILGALNVELGGGAGGENNGGGRTECHGTGGGGAGGVFWTSTASAPTGVTVRAPGGAAGMMTSAGCPYVGTPYGSEPGEPGGSRFELRIPQSTLADSLRVSSDTTICIGDSVRLASNDGSPVRWSPSATLSCATCPAPMATPSVTTTYAAERTLVNGCIVRDSVTVVVVPRPRLSVAQLPPLCSGDSVRLGVSGATSATWSPADGLSCSECTAPFAHPDTTTLYRVTARNANGCVTVDSIVLVVMPKPALAVDDTAFCIGGSATLRASGAASVAWAPIDGLECPTCAETVARPTTTTVYYADLVTDGGCRSRDSVTIIVHPLPALAHGPDTSICAGDSVVLRATSDGTIRWSPSPELSCTDCDSPVARPMRTTTYYMASVSAFGCRVADSVVVTILSRPAVDAGPDTVVCEGESVTLHGNGEGAVRWTPSTDVDCPDCATTIARPAATTTYVLRASNASGCESIDSVTVTVLPQRRLVAHIRRDHVAPIGVPTLVPVIVDEMVGPGIDELRFALQYDPTIILLDAIETDGTLLDGWSRSAETRSPGSIELTFSANGARAVASTGVLLNLSVRGFLGAQRASELAFQISTGIGADSMPCATMAIAPGAIRIDSLCGLTQRLFEIVEGGNVLRPVAPNPIGGSATIAFAIAPGGEVMLEVFDFDGQRIATLLERSLSAGEYRVVWDAGAHPDGLYFVRLTSGDWSQTTPAIVRR
jgi:hypothetical protein